MSAIKMKPNFTVGKVGTNKPNYILVFNFDNLNSIRLAGFDKEEFYKEYKDFPIKAIAGFRIKK